MADVFTKEQRSAVMAAVQSRGNKNTELRLIEMMRAAGLSGWRRNVKLPGHPDFVFPKSRLAVFVDGCFWHGCPSHCRMPSSNEEYWLKKIGRNQKRDRLVSRALRREGWRVLRIWEHSLRHPDRTVARLRACLNPSKLDAKDRIGLAGRNNLVVARKDADKR